MRYAHDINESKALAGFIGAMATLAGAYFVILTIALAS